ncbi:MAG: META domain-containing protein [Chloroflexota bacterium]
MKKLVIGLLALFMLAACTSGTPASLSGKWKLVSYGPASSQTSAVADVDASIEFGSDGKMNGNVGCNGFGGDYKVKGDEITFGPVMSTLMACADPIGMQEASVLAALNQTATFALDGNTLTITSADGTSIIVLARK